MSAQQRKIVILLCLSWSVPAIRRVANQSLDSNVTALGTNPFKPFLCTGRDMREWGSILMEEPLLPTMLQRPSYETMQIKLPWESGVAPLVQCGSAVSSTVVHDMDARLQDAVNIFCDAGLGDFVKFYVDPRFKSNYDRLKGSDGWIDKAFVSYMGITSPHAPVVGEEDLLAQSLKHFSSHPFVLANYNRRMPVHMTPERFPNLIIVHANSTTALHQSFNFNKFTTMMFTKVKHGLALDADQFANRGIDTLLERVGEETTKEYPYPIMPVHWMSRDPESSDMKEYPDAYSWRFVSADAPKRTMRWGHAHPSWSYHALPWLAKWTSYALAPDRTHPPQWLVDQGSIEDEDLMNIGLWADGATKQWCKYDITSPSMFKFYLGQDSPASSFADSMYYPKGIALVYSTAHDAKHPDESFGWLTKIWDENGDHRKGIYYDKHWFGSGSSLREYDPALKCIV